MNQASFYCPQCNQLRLFNQKETNHVLHLLLSFFLLGLWIPVWIILALSSNPYHCAFCGYSDRADYLADPEKRKFEQQTAAFSQETNWNFKYNIGIVIAIVVICIIAVSSFKYILKNSPNSQTSTVVSTPNNTRTDDGFSARTKVASDLQNSLKKKYPDVIISAKGANHESLSFFSPSFRENIYLEMQKNTEFLKLCRSQGFTEILVENSNNEWKIKL